MVSSHATDLCILSFFIHKDTVYINSVCPDTKSYSIYLKQNAVDYALQADGVQRLKKICHIDWVKSTI